MEPITFRPHRTDAAMYSALFLIPAGGVAYLLLNDLFGPESVALAILLCPLLAAAGVYCGLGLLCLRIVADGTGLRRSPWWFGGYRVRWADVLSWSVRSFDPIDNPEGRDVLDLMVRCRLWTVRIIDSEVARPGFAVLVERVRMRPGVGERERSATALGGQPGSSPPPR